MEDLTAKKESWYQSKILTYLRKTYPGAVIWKNQAGPYVKAGVSDILALIDGTFWAFEVKRPGGKATALQHSFINDVNRNGGHAFVVCTVDDVKKAMEGIYGEKTPKR